MNAADAAINCALIERNKLFTVLLVGLRLVKITTEEIVQQTGNL